MKNKYVFNFKEEISYINKLIKKYSPLAKSIYSKYENLENNVNNYKDQRDLMFKYREENLNLLKKAISDYPYFNNNAVIYLTGSYARNTVRLFSDFDLNIVYVKGTSKKYMKYEELFYYYISQIFEFKREGIHAIITAFNNIDNYNYIMDNIDESIINITLKDDYNTINYQITGGYKKRFYLQYMNDKNYKTIFDNLIIKNKTEGIKEWSNNFIFLNDIPIVNKYYEYYQKELIKNIKLNYIKDECNNIINYGDNIKTFHNNIEIKNCIQMTELHYLYNIIVLLQSLETKSTNKIYADYWELYNNTTNSKIKELIELYYEYNYNIYKLNICFKKYNIPYSIHINKEIDMNTYTDLSKILDEILLLRENINSKYINTLKGELENA